MSTAPLSTATAASLPSMRSLAYVSVFILPAVAAAAVFAGGAWLLGPPLLLFVIVPVLDVVLGRDTREIEPDAAATRARDARYDLWLWLYVPVQIGVQVQALRVGGSAIAAGDVLGAAGAIFAAGLLGGIGINVGHELMHRRGRAERALAEVLLTSVVYSHFCVEHVLGHHKNVATPQDPASARRGETVWGFVPRSVIGGLRSAWHLESARVRRLSITNPLADRRVRYPLVLVAVMGVIGLTLGPLAAVAFLLQGAVAIFLLESINFVEHYGLSRAAIGDGRYERVAPAHSWSSAHRLTSHLLVNLPRHADHHAHASRPYFALRHVEEGPQLPAGYGTMLVLAWVPPVWRRVMDPRLDALARSAQGVAR